MRKRCAVRRNFDARERRKTEENDENEEEKDEVDANAEQSPHKTPRPHNDDEKTTGFQASAPMSVSPKPTPEKSGAHKEVKVKKETPEKVSKPKLSTITSPKRRVQDEEADRRHSSASYLSF